MTLQLSKLKPYLLLLLILLLAYLPVSTFHFAMKNDAFSDNFPNKFFLTQALHSGFLPLWNPYLNFGFPVYSDPGFAFFNPITWFFGAVIGYNAYSLTIEVLLYIYIAGITMYRLGKYFEFTFTTAVTVAAMYMCSGFFTGELQHINFLTSAAFLPFLLQQFLTLSKTPYLKNACVTAVAYYAVFAGGHPAMPVGCIYFLFILSVSFFFFTQNKNQNWKPLLLFHLLSILLFLILYSPAIYSYLNIIRDYGRGTPANQFDKGAMQTGFSASSYISFLFPFATVKSVAFLTDDLAMRNGYFSIAGFILVLTQLRNKSALSRCLIVCTIAMLILSFGGNVKTIIYSHMPFLNYIRTNGEFRIFSVLCLSILAGMGLDKIVLKENKTFVCFQKTLKILLVVESILMVVIAVNYLIHKSNTSRNFLNIGETGLKSIVDNITFTDAFFISIIINIALIILLLWAKADGKKLRYIIITDLIINAIIYLPFSGVGVVTLPEVQAIYNKSSKGITIPSMLLVKKIDTLPTKTAGLVGSWSFYNKNIGITELQDYPSYFSTTEAYFNSDLPKVINAVPYIFLKSNIDSFSNKLYSAKAVIVNSFSPQKISISVNTPSNDSLVLLQNYYKHWHAKIDGQPVVISKIFITFMSTPLVKGQHVVEFFYEDNWLFVFIIISLITFAILITIIFFSDKIKGAFKET